MPLKLFLLVVSLGFLVASSLSARILGIVPIPSYSHQIAFQPLWRELSLRGHQLTVLTTDPINDPSLTNLTEINLHFSYEMWNKESMFDMSQMSIFEAFGKLLSLSANLLDEQLQHPKVQMLLRNKDEHFDLLIVEGLITGMYAFAERFNCPFIQVTSLEASSYNYDVIGNPAHPVLNPDIMLPFAGQLTFFERLASTFLSVYIKYRTIFYENPNQDLVIKKHFGDGFPFLEDIARNVSMMFVNTDPIFQQIRPLLPNVVQIGGGTHLKPSQPLSKDLQLKLDGASQGFIYFSLGSNVKSRELSVVSRRILLEAFAELPYTVLWKFELEDLPGKPKNVIISRWFPQQDIFRHSNIKLFITQGGLQSMEEAVYNHIPIVGMPFFGDQHTNTKRVVAKGFGLVVDPTILDKASFKKTILEVINNPKYRNKVKELAELAQDQPTTGLERAVWWTEYVLRHKGAKHLRSPAMDLPFYQYFLLDVIGFCLLVALLLIYLLLTIGKSIFKLIKYFKSISKLKIQ